MIRLLLMRHGNTFETGETPIQVGARTDLPLTVYGRKQAESIADCLLAEKIFPEAVYAGNLKRQKESAQMIAARSGLPLLPAPALTEIDYGLWEGLTTEEIAARWPKEHAEWAEGKWQASIFGGHLEKHLQAIEEWLNSLRKKKEGIVLGVTSGGILRLFRNEKVKTGYICAIDLFEGSFEIRHWNINPQYGERFRN